MRIVPLNKHSIINNKNLIDNKIIRQDPSSSYEDPVVSQSCLQRASLTKLLMVSKAESIIEIFSVLIYE